MRLVNESLDLLLPFGCDICGGYADALRRCGRIEELYRKLYPDLPPFHICSRCLSGLVPQERDKRWFTCLSNPVEDDPYADLALFMPFSYSGIVDKAMPAIKFEGKRELARLFGILLGTAVREEGISPDLVMPVPLSSVRYRERGYNQAEEIAFPVSVMTSGKLVTDAIVRTRNTSRQSGITGSCARLLNVSGAFELSEAWDVTGCRVLLIDDVSTTGHTLRECAVPLLEGGAKEVLCCAFAGNRQLKNDEPF